MKYMVDINDDNWMMASLFELSLIDNEDDRNRYCAYYEEEYHRLQELYPDISLSYGSSIRELYYLSENAGLEHQSTYLFPGDTVFFYPKMEVLVAHKQYTCYVSGAVIQPGSEYIRYKAFLYNKTKEKSYVTFEFITEFGCTFSFPTTLEEFEILCSRLEHAYELGLESEYQIESSIKGPLVRMLRRRK